MVLYGRFYTILICSGLIVCIAANLKLFAHKQIKPKEVKNRWKNEKIINAKVKKLL